MSIRINQLATNIALGVALVGAISFTQANANEFGYPASSCTAGNASHSNLVITRNGEAFNKNTTNALDVLCPVIIATNKAGLDVSLFLKKATAEKVNCFVHSRYDDGSGGAIKTGSATGTGAKIVYFSGVSKFSTANMGCSIPKATSDAASGRTGIVSYFSNEY